MALVRVESELRDILPGFIKNRHDDIIKLKELWKNNDLASIQKIGHKVAGSAGGYGFDELGKIAKHMEESAKRQNREEVIKSITAFENFINNVEIEFIE